MLAQTRAKLRNAETSISFLQEQHSKTLEGLHQEIQKLQQQNARLTFELAMKGTPTAAASVPECGECRHLGEELKTSKAEILSLRSSLSSHDDKIYLLEHQAKELEKRFVEELQTRDNDISQLRLEVEEKSNTIAHLMQQLLQSKLKLRAVESSLEASGSGHPHNCHHSHHQHYTRSSVTASSDSPSTVYLESDLQERHHVAHSSKSDKRTRRSVSSPVPREVTSIAGSLGSHTRSKRQLSNPPPLSPHPPSTPPHPHLFHRRLSSTSHQYSDSPAGTSQQNHSSNYRGLTPRPPSNPPSTSYSSNHYSKESKRSLDLVRVRRHKTTPPDARDMLYSRGEQVEAVTRPAAPVLPPIRSESLVAPRSPDDPPRETSAESVREHSDPQVLTKTHFPRKHQHIILAKSQGLGSAPCSIRVLRYSRAVLAGGEQLERQFAGDEETEEEDEDEEEEEYLYDDDEEEEEEEEEEGEEEEGAVEGMLLVRETVVCKDRKNCINMAQTDLS